MQSSSLQFNCYINWYKARNSFLFTSEVIHLYQNSLSQMESSSKKKHDSIWVDDVQYNFTDILQEKRLLLDYYHQSSSMALCVICMQKCSFKSVICVAKVTKYLIYRYLFPSSNFCYWIFSKISLGFSFLSLLTCHC